MAEAVTGDNDGAPRRRVLRSRWMRWLLRLLILLGLLSAGYAYFWYSSERKLSAALERLDAVLENDRHGTQARAILRGEPIFYPPKPAPGEPLTREETRIEESLAAYRGLFDEIERIEPELHATLHELTDDSHDAVMKRPELRTLEEQLHYEQWEQSYALFEETVAARYEDLIYSILAATQLGGPVVRLDLSDIDAMRYEHCTKVRGLVRLLAIHAGVTARQGAPDEAVAEIISGLQLADALSDPPVGISHIARYSLVQMMTDVSQRYLFVSEIPSEGALFALDEQLRRSRNQRVFNAALPFETAISLRLFNQLKTGKRDLLVHAYKSFDRSKGIASVTRRSDKFRNRHWVYRLAPGPVIGAFYISPFARPWVNRDERIYLEAKLDLYDASTLQYHEALPTVSQLEQELHMTLLPYVQSTIQMQTLLFRFEAECNASIDLTRLGLAVERFHAQHGVWPKSLDAVASMLTGGAPMDPFSGMPYRYVVQEDGFLLYSVGRNGVDDGGVNERQIGDIVWRAEG